MKIATMQAGRLFEIGKFQVETIPIPQINGNEILVKVGACGICGSDIPRIFESGANGKLPLTLGHEFSGTIVDVGEKADKSLIGKKGAIFPLIPCFDCSSCEIGKYAQCNNYNYLGSRCDGGFAEYCKVPSAWHFVESNNDSTSLESLAMVEPACVAQHAIRLGGVTAGQTIVIFGAGPIGIIAARWAKIFGVRKVILADVIDEKVEFANEHGILTVNCLKKNIVDFIKKNNNGKLADVVIEGTGTSAAFNNCVECISNFGTIVLLGNPRKDIVINQRNFSTLLRKEIKINSIWNSNFANTPINEWRYTVDMIDTGILTVEDLITHRSSLNSLPNLCNDIFEHKITICKAICNMM